MKNKTIFLALVIMLSLSSTISFAENPDRKSTDKNAIPVKTENKLSAEELSRLTRRVEEIRDMDKSNLTAKDKRVLKKELKDIKENVKKQSGYVYVGVTTLILLVILLILLV